MTFAVALENNNETIHNLEFTLNVLKSIENSETYSKQDMDDAIEWLDDIHKILTEFAMFSSTEEDIIHTE